MSVTSEKQTMAVRWNRFDLVGMCAGAEPGSERLRGSIMQGSEARKKEVVLQGSVEVPRGISAGLECTLRVPPSGAAGNGNNRSKGLEALGASWEAEGFGSGRLLTGMIVGTGRSE